MHMTDDLLPALPPEGAGQQTPVPFLGGPEMVAAAALLAREFGDDAAMAASLRAARSRANDNPISYCRWREVERLVGWMTDGGVGATRH
jgi:hypothetical protein